MEKHWFRYRNQLIEIASFLKKWNETKRNRMKQNEYSAFQCWFKLNSNLFNQLQRNWNQFEPIFCGTAIDNSIFSYKSKMCVLRTPETLRPPNTMFYPKLIKTHNRISKINEGKEKKIEYLSLFRSN